MVTRTASCSCGQLALTVDGDPQRVSVCHCLDCQRRTGSAFGLFARFDRDRVTVSGESRAYDRPSEQGESRTIHFCPECGGTVYYELPSLQAMVAVAVGSFAEPDFPAPTHSLWESRRHPWVAVPAGAAHRDR